MCVRLHECLTRLTYNTLQFITFGAAWKVFVLVLKNLGFALEKKSRSLSWSPESLDLEKSICLGLWKEFCLHHLELGLISCGFSCTAHTGFWILVVDLQSSGVFKGGDTVRWESQEPSSVYQCHDIIISLSDEVLYFTGEIDSLDTPARCLVQHLLPARLSHTEQSKKGYTKRNYKLSLVISKWRRQWQSVIPHTFYDVKRQRHGDRLRATTLSTINGSSILTTTDRVWHGPFIIVL